MQVMKKAGVAQTEKRLGIFLFSVYNDKEEKKVYARV
jgi:hypothetical protein